MMLEDATPNAVMHPKCDSGNAIYMAYVTCLYCLHLWAAAVALLLRGCASLYRSASPALAGLYLTEVQALLLDGQLEAIPTGEADLLAVLSWHLSFLYCVHIPRHAKSQPPVLNVSHKQSYRIYPNVQHALMWT